MVLEMTTRRKYELKKRAERLDEVRSRIVDAAISLHEEVGPANTTITEIARRAGVGRLTVYRHFPDDEALYRACGAEWMSRYPAPDPRPWLTIEDPEERVRVALDELYAHYERAERLLSNVFRDAGLIPPLRRVLDENVAAIVDEMRDALVRGWNVRGRRKAHVRAALGVALGLQTWQSLVRDGLDRAAAVKLATALVHAAASSRR
jgi:AcrR family transcriptional regulator